MKHLIFGVALLHSIGLFAQLPNAHEEIPPTLKDDVLCWFPLENHFDDISADPLPTEPVGAMDFEANADDSTPFSSYTSFSGGVVALGSPERLKWPISRKGAYSVWFRPQNTSPNGRLFSGENTECCQDFEYRHSGSSDSFAQMIVGMMGAEGISIVVPRETWSHVVVNGVELDNGDVQTSIYLNGEVVHVQDPVPANEDILTIYMPNGYDDFFIGQKASSAYDKWGGDVAHMVWFSRSLNDNEIDYMLSGSVTLLSACTDPLACNFNESALAEDLSTCDYSCCPGPGCCTEGMYWDWELSGCYNINPADINLDGCVQLNDLLDLLSAYGNCALEESAWQCGDLLEYQGYDYATVLIGEQCWFAENLRNENYENGDAIPLGFAFSGAMAVYGDGSPCNNFSPSGDACDETWSLNEYGRLYNWYAVDDPRNLCPNGWQVPTDGEWMAMEMALGMSDSEANNSGWRGTNQGAQMKTDFGWHNGGNGNDLSGFSGLPGGLSSAGDSYHFDAGARGFWWTSSLLGSNAWSRELHHDYESVQRGTWSRDNFMSVRCILDAE